MATNDFDDDEHLIVSTQGVLAGGAFDDVEKIREKPRPDGIEFQCTCNHCSRPARILIPWEELVTAMAGAVPLDRQSNRPWTVQPGPNGAVMYPAAFCRCGVQYPIPMMPDKAQKMVRTGISMGVLSPQQVEQQVHYVKQRMQGYRG